MTPPISDRSYSDRLFLGGGFFYSKGYGVCYVPMKNTMRFNISASTKDKSRDTQNFAESIKKAMEDLVEILSKNK